MRDPTVAGVYKQKDHSCTKGFIIIPIILITEQLNFTMLLVLGSFWFIISLSTS